MDMNVNINLNIKPAASAALPSPSIAIPTPAAARRIVRRRTLLLAGLLSLLMFLLAGALTLHAYIAWHLGRPVVAPLESNPLLAIGTPYEDVRFTSANGSAELSGWYIPSSRPSDKTVVFSHGYGANREEHWVPMYELADALHRKNYNVIMFDYLFASQEYSGIATGGIDEAHQLLGAVRLAKERGAGQVFVWGFSMGAGTALQAALDTKAIDGMILDSLFLLDPDTLFHNVKQAMNLPREPSLSLLRLFFPIVNGVRLSDVPYQRIHEETYSIPMFIIHGGLDEKAPYQVAEQIAANQKSVAYSNYWFLPHGHHELLYRAGKSDYLNRTLGFLDRISVTNSASR